MAKQHYCFLERFNNYFNRKVIRHESLEDYQNASEDFFIPSLPDNSMMPFDFNPNDNITTEIIANEVPFDPDYFLLLDAEGEIVSRWFVLEQKRNRQGQWLYFLRRDVLADSFEEIASAPVYVERGIINDLASPLLLNNEDLKVNQIKKKEILLKDLSGCPWIVMYLKKGVLGNSGIGPDSDGTITLNIPQEDAYVFEELTTPIAQWQYYQYLTSDYLVNDQGILEVYFNDSLSKVKYQLEENGASSKSASLANIFNPWYPSNLMPRYTTQEPHEKEYLDAQFVPNHTSLHNSANSAFGYSKDNVLMKYNGKIIKDSDGKYYEVSVKRLTGGTVTRKITTADAPALKATMTTYWNNAFDLSQTANDDAFKFKVTYSGWRISLEERKDLETKIDFGAYTGEGTKDSALYDVICAPYGTDVLFSDPDALTMVWSEKERSMITMNSIARILTSQYVLDLQLIPFCPVPDYLSKSVSLINITAGTWNDTAVLGKHSGDITDVFVVCPSVNFTNDIKKTVEIEDTSDVPSSYKIKYLNDCTMIRLCSPNYNGLFEMNLAKNGGNIVSFNLDVTLRPFNPYIHVNPKFDFVYGEDFNDIRGLICGGDFSLGIINDAWNVYEIQNKNYQAIFDRQIQNLDINNAINKTEAVWGAVAGTVQGAGAGAVGGAMVGGGYGAVAGAVIGGVASGIGGAMDVANLEKRQQEARNYAIDNFNLQLGNVRALPYSITKTSPLTFNNKLFVFVEIYECTDVEKQAYYEKIKYNGMSIRIIDKMENYWSGDNSQYFRAKLIRITNISEDNHYVETINEELMKGVFI